MTDNLRHIAKRIRGFTLIETLVAVLILATAIAGPLTIASKGLQTALVAKDQTIAYYLAQDAMEYARFSRDSNKLSATDWLQGPNSGSTDLGPCASTDGSVKCYLDTLSQSPTVPTECTGTCPALNFYLDPVSKIGRFTYASVGGNVTQSIFTRSIIITNPIGGNLGDATIEVIVTWTDTPPGVVHRVDLQEDLYNWQ